MKIFVATSEEQGLRPSDYFNTKEGDWVFFPFECGKDADNIDGSCGCRRSMDSNDPHGSTTTFKVADLDITKEEYFNKFVANDNEYAALKEKYFEDDPEYYESQVEMYEKQLEELLEAASKFPVGIVLEKRGDDIHPRSEWNWIRKREDEY